MCRTCHKAEEPCGERTEVGDVCGMLAQEFGCQAYKIVQTASCLQCSGSRDDRHDDEHHVDRQIAGFQSEDEHEYEHAYHSVDTESDAAYARTFKDESQYDGKL